MLTNAGYLAILQREGDAFADSIARAMDTSIASCEPWVGADLLWHMIEVHYSWKFIVESHLMNSDDYVPRSKPADKDLLTEHRAGLDDLINVLSSLDPARSCWTWAGIQDVAWVIRRMAHETAVHAWDAHCATGKTTEIYAVLASDGIDEFVHVMVMSNMRDEDRDMKILPWIDEENFNPNYLLRSMHLLPKRGEKKEWAHTQDYWAEREEIPQIDLADPARPGAVRESTRGRTGPPTGPSGSTFSCTSRRPARPRFWKNTKESSRPTGPPDLPTSAGWTAASGISDAMLTHGATL